MQLMRCAVIVMSGVLCQACASDTEQAKPSSASTAASKPTATASRSSALPSQRPDSANMQILMDKVRADKKLLVAENMQLTDAEAARFWPLYEDYQRDLHQINQRLGSTIADYAEAYQKGPIPDETAARLLDQALVVDEEEVALKRSYADKFNDILPATKAARYLQIETKIRSILRFELAKNIPLVS
ncbi:MAG: hypothetical protein ABW047_15620 [Nitrospiraceae bacterium]